MPNACVRCHRLFVCFRGFVAAALPCADHRHSWPSSPPVRQPQLAAWGQYTVRTTCSASAKIFQRLTEIRIPPWVSPAQISSSHGIHSQQKVVAVLSCSYAQPRSYVLKHLTHRGVAA